MESNNVNFASLIDLIRNRLGVFITVGIVSIAVGVFISMPFIMTPLYKSAAVIYPVDVQPYSDESETEQLLQYIQASAIRDSIVDKFNLYERYEIDPESESSRYYLIELFNERFVFSKTLYESVRVEVADEDPAMAKQMCDEVLRQVNLKYNSVINRNALLKATSYKEQMDYQRTVIDTIEAAISQLSADNRVLEYGSQTRELVRGYIQLSSQNGKSEALEDIDKWLQSTQEAGSVLKMLQNLSYFGTVEHNELGRNYMFWREVANRELNYIEVIVSPEVSDKKFWPVRWLVVLISFVSAMLLTLVVLAISKPAPKG